jgi:hypothetical protein
VGGMVSGQDGGVWAKSSSWCGPGIAVMQIGPSKTQCNFLDADRGAIKSGR